MNDPLFAGEPVSLIETDSIARKPDPGIALCLSGGGYRAMLFHTGTLMRLNELHYLPILDRISSVSGGSIASGVLGFHWNKLSFVNGVASNFESVVIKPILEMADHTIDVGSIVFGAL